PPRRVTGAAVSQRESHEGVTGLRESLSAARRYGHVLLAIDFGRARGGEACRFELLLPKDLAAGGVEGSHHVVEGGRDEDQAARCGYAAAVGWRAGLGDAAGLQVGILAVDFAPGEVAA